MSDPLTTLIERRQRKEQVEANIDPMGLNVYIARKMRVDPNEFVKLSGTYDMNREIADNLRAAGMSESEIAMHERIAPQTPVEDQPEFYDDQNQWMHTFGPRFANTHTDAEYIFNLTGGRNLNKPFDEEAHAKRMRDLEGNPEERGAGERFGRSFVSSVMPPIAEEMSGRARFVRGRERDEGVASLAGDVSGSVAQFIPALFVGPVGVGYLIGEHSRELAEKTYAETKNPTAAIGTGVLSGVATLLGLHFAGHVFGRAAASHVGKLFLKGDVQAGAKAIVELAKAGGTVAGIRAVERTLDELQQAALVEDRTMGEAFDRIAETMPETLAAGLLEGGLLAGLIAGHRVGQSLPHVLSAARTRMQMGRMIDTAEAAIKTGAIPGQNKGVQRRVTPEQVEEARVWLRTTAEYLEKQGMSRLSSRAKAAAEVQAQPQPTAEATPARGDIAPAQRGAIAERSPAEQTAIQRRADGEIQASPEATATEEVTPTAPQPETALAEQATVQDAGLRDLAPPDLSLRDLSDSDFYRQRQQIENEAARLEDEATLPEHLSRLHQMHDRIGQFELEHQRREMRNLHPDDLFDRFLRHVERVSETAPEQSQDFYLAQLAIEELARQGPLGRVMSDEVFQRAAERGPDGQVILRAKMEKAARLGLIEAAGESSIQPARENLLAEQAQPEVVDTQDASMEAATDAPREPWQMTQEEFVAESTQLTDATERPASWVVQNKETGEIVTELFSEGAVQKLNTAKYEAIPITEYDSATASRRPVDAEAAAQRKIDQTSNMELRHRNAIESAIARGETVPAEVLADYPDLAAQIESTDMAQTDVPPVLNNAARIRRQASIFGYDPPAWTKENTNAPDAPWEAELAARTEVPNAPELVEAAEPVDTAQHAIVQYREGDTAPLQEWMMENHPRYAELDAELARAETAQDAAASDAIIRQMEDMEIDMVVSGSPPETLRRGGYRRTGHVDIDLLAAPVRAAVAATKWTASAVRDAARWVWHMGLNTARAAREALRMVFGDRVLGMFDAIWGTARRMFTGTYGSNSLPKTAMQTAKPADIGLILRFGNAIKNATPKPRSEYEAIKKAHRRQQAARLHSVKRGASGEAAVKQSLGAMRGEIEKPAFEALRGKFTQAEIDALIDHALHHELFRVRVHAGANLANQLLAIFEHGILPDPSAVAAMEIVFGPQVAAALARKHGSRTTRQVLYDVWNMPKSIKASMDISATLRQGLLAATMRPDIASRAYAQQIRAFGDEEYSRDIDFAIRSDRDFDAIANTMGVYIAPIGEAVSLNEREEHFASTIASKLIPGIRASERAFVTYLNVLRYGVAKWQYNRMRSNGIDPETESGAKALRSVGHAINAATGRSNLTMGELGLILNGIFFSPRYMMSRIEAPVRMGVGMPMHKGARLFAAWSLTANVGALLGIAALLKIASEAFDWDAEVILDVKDPRFGRIAIGGNTTIDVTAGEGIVFRTVAQMMSGERVDPLTGKTMRSDATVAWAKFFENKMSPTMRGVWNVFVTGERFGGKELTPEGMAVDLFVPITVEQISEVIEEHGAAGLWLMVPEIHGAGVHIYDPVTRQPRRRKTPVGAGR